MDYFIADLHFGHNNIIKLCNRPFSSVDEMDEAFVSAWNAKVKKKADTVYIVGDLVWEKADPLKYIRRLNGHKVLITGNHDKKWLTKNDYSEYFDQIVPYLEIKSNNVDITLCHYPMLEWKNSRKLGSKKLGYLIHGHIHNRYCDDYKTLFMMPHALNAGVDINGFAPVSFEELIKNNESYKLSKLLLLVEKAEFLASKYHLYQLDKAGRPYIEHPRAVAAPLIDEDCKITAFLHDIVEDTDIDIELLKETFSERVVNAILSMTHKEEEDYFSYVERLCKNPIARQVKRSDLTHNINLGRLKNVTEKDLERVEKYKKAMAILSRGEQMKKEYNVLSKVVDVLATYDTPEYDINKIEEIFDQIKFVFDEFKVNLEKGKYEIENYFIRYYFSSDKETVLKRALKYVDDIRLRLQCLSVRAYISNEKECVCIEVVNPQRHVAGLKELLSQPIKNENKNGRYCVIGKVNSKALYSDITKMPHLLTAGATGSGKSVLIHEIIVSLIARYSPEELKLLLIDPKCVEFGVYDDLPHLINGKSIYQLDDILDSLDSLINEMNNRYEMFANLNVRNIDEYNKHAEEAKMPLMQKIVVVVDEFADLMLADKKHFENAVMTLATKSRAAGIHLILATQRPSKDTITPTIKACLPSRIACKLITEIDSKFVLDEGDARNLVGNGDLLYRDVTMLSTVRALAGYVSLKEIREIVTIIKKEYYEN